MKKKYNLHGKFVALLLMAVTTMAGCSKWDEYEKYTAGGEATYTGKLDSVKVFPGKKRVKITGLANADPKLTAIKFFYNNNSDSIIFDAKTSISNGLFNQTFVMPEGVFNFTIYTMDAAGNKSVPVQAIATVYGDKYESSLLNRPVNNAQSQPNGSAVIDWTDVNANAGVLAMQMRYTNVTGNTRDTTLFTNGTVALSSTIPNYKPGTTFQYRTAYKPVPDAIDTFYTTYQTQSVKYDVDVTSQYLSNTATPFANMPPGDGRFAKLPAPWVTNTAGLNKGNGTYGGWAAEPWNGTTGFINWETWGNTPITDGIIYQPTALPLPSGNYTVQIDYYSEVQSNSSVHCVVAAGANGIPVLGNLSSALASTPLYNGAAVGSTQPSRSEVKIVKFSITQPQIVSIGLLGNMSVNNYFIIRSIKLIENR